jgi:DNA-directed RNA polymerase specialized sigma subunit
LRGMKLLIAEKWQKSDTKLLENSSTAVLCWPQRKGDSTMTLGEKIASARKEKGMTQEMLAEQLGESVENVAMAIQAAQPAMSLTPEGREDAEHQLDIPVESPEEALADRISLEEVLRALPEQDRQLIQLRFYGNRTQSETAKVLHTTQVQISRRERKILVLLRRRLLEE